MDINEEDVLNNLYDEGFIYNQDSSIKEEKMIRINNESFENCNINEIDGINRCINKLKFLDYYSPLNLKHFEGYNLPKSNIYENFRIIPIEQLYNQSIYLA